jgi:hypothetical protein
MQQKSNQEFWIDETGNKIPYNRTSATERLQERLSTKLLKEAKQINERLDALKENFRNFSNGVYELFLKERSLEMKADRKGNYTWYNFDRSIKVEVSVSERITFDDMSISAAREKLSQFLDENIEGKLEFVKDLVNEAFQTSKGQLDTKKVMGLLKYRSKIKHQAYQEAMNLIEQSIRRPDSKAYYRIWEKDNQGEYKLVDLNFSSL